MPAPPARIASASEPWGISSTSIAPDWAACTASGLLVKKEPMAFLICPLRSRRPPPSPGFADVVGDVGQVAHVGLRQRVEQMHRVAGHAEAADEDRLAVFDSLCGSLEEMIGVCFIG